MIKILWVVKEKTEREGGGERILVVEDVLCAKPKAGEIVKISFPPHLLRFPLRGGLLYLSLHVEHLKPCIENFLRLPLISLIKCLSIINLATSLTSTALILPHK